MNNLPRDKSEKDKTTLMWVLSIFTGFLAPIIFFCIATEELYLKRQSAISLTTQIAVFILMTILGITVVGIVLMPFVGILSLVVCIMGAMAASKGEDFNPKYITDLTQKIFKM